ncbi:hypothetical protein GO013_03770 [Pseudodesulfovibrio sp. JC047]|uniref:hypothetical protein n=1 Tax=Pseudodesulfovibrio sp. JC047 TaxID=2683199 RepID=UPI0013D13F1A|nr:hypothetical protein [Pseudodesulfovibrio sp. JC047]NDV18536.1 hypothetical protein [Pseudodesulfovibrio sp. JC047]
MHKTTTILLTAALVLATAIPAQAWRSIQNGDRNFERAWRAYTSRQTDKATGYFTKAADLYAEGLNQDPPTRTARFPSTLAKAGIAFYAAGRYQECIETMKLTLTRDDRMWEPALYTALSYARLGDAEKTKEELHHFVTRLSSQRFISDMVTKQITELEAGTTSLDAAADALDSVTQYQFIENINRNYSPRDVGLATERCNAAYWWRRNMEPCSASGIVTN